MRAFLALTSFKSHAWRGSPCWHCGPSLTTEPPSKKLAFSILRPESLTHPGCELPSSVRSRRVPPGHPALPFRLYLSDSESWSPIGLPSDAGESLPARQPYLFHPTAGETYPSRPRVFSSCRMSARASRPHSLHCYVFTCPTQRVLISGWTPARCSRPDNLTFFCLYLSNTASLDLPLDAGEVLPARQSYFLCLYLSNTASPGISLDAGEVLPARQSYFLCLYLSNKASPGISLDAGEVLPARQILLFLSLPVQHSES